MQKAAGSGGITEFMETAMTEKTFPASDEALPEVMSFVEENLEAFGCTMKAIMQISVCVEEIFVNIAHYAYGEGIGNMTLSLSSQDNKVCLVFSDNGVPFDPLAKEDPDITLSAEERPVGGLGIFMVKKVMDEVDYEYRDGKNVFTMKKCVL